MKTRELTIGAVFAALSILIPLAFGGFLTLHLGPFTATIMSHVPLFLSMLISPQVAAMVGASSALGFFIKLGRPEVTARALMHIIVGYFGGWLVKRGVKYEIVLLIVLPIHALLEAFIVIPIVGLDYRMFYIVAVGTAIHHLIDSAISVFFARTTGLYTLKKSVN
ncbi:MAG: transporter component [Caloramator sp.]|jgi:niacin transporter|uniref:ECF transporter S component n=1 Tax=Caloramator sp. TaxID=1871330 RepID=UPI001D84F74C|nr:ECF transporter S component [Caloramator sp.]MBZ4662836.1 transporter component [Caloramator sp.]